jgi:hypothetical protein
MIMNGGGCGSGAVRPFPSRGGSAADRETMACRAPYSVVLSPRFGPRCCQRCRPPPSTTPSSAVDPAIVVIHVVFRRCQRRRCLPSTPTLSLPTLSSPMSSSAAAAAAAITTAVSAAIAAAFWLIVVCGPCLVCNPPPPLPRSSCRLMTSSSHRGRRRWMTPTPARPMPGGHRFVVALIHRRPSPLAATARSLRGCRRRCHLHSPRRRQNDRRRRR